VTGAAPGQVVRSQTSEQSQTVGELRFDGAWDLGDDDRVNFGANYRESKMNQMASSTQNALGDWGVGQIGDIKANAADLMQEFCLACKFHDYNTGATGALLNEFFAYARMSTIQAGMSEKARLIASFALCGFANFSSIGIQIGGIGGLAPTRKGDIARLGFRALLGGSLASFMTATIAGLLAG